jgi:hypothetical protein
MTWASARRANLSYECGRKWPQQIALDVEPLLHEADVLLTAATIIRRQSQTQS